MKQSNIDRRARDKKAAVVGVTFFAGLQLVTAAAFGSLCFIPDSPVWLVVLFGALAALCLLLVIPALVVMKQRFKEIEGGDLDEASEY